MVTTKPQLYIIGGGNSKSVYNGSNIYLNPNTEIETQTAMVYQPKRRGAILIYK